MSNGLWLDVYRTGLEADLPPLALNATLPEIYFATDTRRFYLRVGDTWTLYQPAVGTVSQTGGVPTGAVIERGSNANGDWTRFADGTQICTRLDSASRAVATGAFGGFISPAVTWTYPVPFSVTPRVSATAVDNTANGALLGAVTATTAAFHNFCVATQTAATRATSLMAIGRWF